MPFVMRRAFTALMVQQVPQVVDLAPVPHRCTEHPMRLLEVRDEEAASAPKIE
jgi:hypothetical protein